MAAPVDTVTVTAGDTSAQNSLNGANGNGSIDHATNGAPTSTTAQSLSADEMGLYDRQIRLWGAQAQQQIRSAKVLLISLRALGTEIAKNLTLAGISSLTIVDSEPVTEEDLGAGFFLREEDIGKPRGQAAAPRIQELNPRVEVKADSVPDDLLQNYTYYAPFDCVIACDHDFMTLSGINTAARFASRPFYAAGIHGFYGYIFADLVGHEFVIEREKSNIPTALIAETLTRSVIGVTDKESTGNGKAIEIVKKAEIYCPLLLANTSPLPMDVLGNRRKMKSVPPLLPCLRALFDFQREKGDYPAANPQDLQRFAALAKMKTAELGLPAETLTADFLKSFVQNIGAEITPTAAFVGGRLSEDVINVLGKREQPIQNFALFDGDALEGRIYCLYTIPPEMQLNPNLPMPDITMTGDMSSFMGMGGDMSAMNGMPMVLMQNLGAGMDPNVQSNNLDVSSGQGNVAAGNVSGDAAAQNGQSEETDSQQTIQPQQPS